MRPYNFFTQNHSRNQRRFEKNFKTYQQQQAFLYTLAKHPELMWTISSQRGNKALGYCLVLIILNMLPTLVSAVPETKATTSKIQPSSRTFRANNNNSSISEENLFASSHSAVNLGKNSNHLHPIEPTKNTATDETPRVRKRKPQPSPQKNYVLSPLYQQQLTAAHSIFDTIRESAPERFNLPDAATFNADTPQISYSLTSPEAIARQKNKQETLKTILQTTDTAVAAQKKVLAAELTRQALANPIMCKSKEEMEAVNKEYNALQKYLLRLKELMVFAETGVQFKGGTCGHQSALAIREALKKGIDIELISLKSSYGNHTFAIIGRDPNKKLDDPLNWNDDAIIIDLWRYGNGTITMKELKQHSKNYNYYFHKTWQWTTEKFSAQMPENLKGEFYNQYQQLREYFVYCQQKLSEIIHGDTVDLEATPSFRK